MRHRKGAPPVDVPCSSGKQTFPSMKAARAHAAVSSKHLRKQLAVYRCAKCGNWHMSSILDGGGRSYVASGQREAEPRGGA